MTAPDSSRLSRRRALTGASVVGGVAAAASLLPLAPAAPQAQAAAGKPAADAGGGYQVTEHVLRYYQTARV